MALRIDVRGTPDDGWSVAEFGVIGEKAADFDLRIWAELQSTEELQDQLAAETNGGVALFAAHDSDRLEALACGRLEQVRRPELERTAPFTGNRASAEPLEQGQSHPRIVEPFRRNVRFR